MKLLAAFSVVLLVAPAVVACGAGTRQAIDTATLVRTLKSAGFRDIEVISNKESLSKLAKELHDPVLESEPLDEDTVLTRGYNTSLTMPIAAVRLPSTKMAVRRVASDKRLLRGTLSPSERKLLPQSYDASHLSEVRICNIVMTSYNPSSNRALNERFRRAVARLRQHC